MMCVQCHLLQRATECPIFTLHLPLKHTFKAKLFQTFSRYWCKSLKGCVCVIPVLHQWRITLPEGERISLTFNSLDLVPLACGDFVQVYDGHTPAAASLGKKWHYTLVSGRGGTQGEEKVRTSFSLLGLQYGNLRRFSNAPRHFQTPQQIMSVT